MVEESNEVRLGMPSKMMNFGWTTRINHPPEISRALVTGFCSIADVGLNHLP